MDKWCYEIVHVRREDVIRHCVNNDKWQDFRLTLKGISTQEKLLKLRKWLMDHYYDDISFYQVNNYMGALKRGGQIDAEGYVVK